MRDPGMGYPSAAGGEPHSGQTSDAGRRALCIYHRTDSFVDWPSAIRLPLAGCPGCQRPGPAGRDIAPLKGRPAAESSRTTPTARAECYLAAPVPATRFSTGWHPMSLTALFTARTGPMQAIGAPVAPNPAARPSLALLRQGAVTMYRIPGVVSASTTKPVPAVPPVRPTPGLPPGSAQAPEDGRATGPAHAIPGQAEDRERIALGLDEVVVRRLLTVGHDLQAALGLMGDHPASGQVRHAVDEMNQAIRDIGDIRDTISAHPSGERPPRHVHEHKLNQESNTGQHGKD